MPSGKVHLRIESVFLLVWLAAAVLLAGQHWVDSRQIAGFVSAYLFSMLFLSPDLDLTKSDAYRRWGPLRWLWAPYSAIFRHRQVSHHPILGPITRIAYSGAIALIGLLIYVLIGGRDVPRFAADGGLIAAVLIGLYVPNLIHIAADALQSAWDRRRGRL